MVQLIQRDWLELLTTNMSISLQQLAVLRCEFYFVHSTLLFFSYSCHFHLGIHLSEMLVNKQIAGCCEGLLDCASKRDPMWHFCAFPSQQGKCSNSDLRLMSGLWEFHHLISAYYIISGQVDSSQPRNDQQEWGTHLVLQGLLASSLCLWCIHDCGKPNSLM